MKVLIYFNKNELAPTGGPKGYLYNLYNELVNENIDCIDFLDIDITNNESIKTKIQNKIPKRVKRIIKKVAGKSEYNYIKIFLSNSKRESVVDLNKYDIVHFQSAMSMYNTQDSLKNYKGLVLLTSHSPKAAFKEIIEDDIPMDEYLKHKKDYDKLEIIDEYAYNRADYILFPTKEAEECKFNSWDKYKKIHDDNSEKFIYLPTGIIPVTIYEDKNIIKNRYNIPQDAFVISYIGRHNETKGYDQLKLIGEKILEKIPNAYFLIGGKEEPLKGIDNDRWIEVGWTNRPHDLVNASDLFVLPNKETYFDLVLLEVLSVGKPVVMTNTGGNKYFEKFKESAMYYYEYGNIDEAVSIISDLQKKDLSTLGEINKKILENNFTIEIFTKKYIDLLETLNKNKKL